MNDDWLFDIQELLGKRVIMVLWVCFFALLESLSFEDTYENISIGNWICFKIIRGWGPGCR